MIDLICGARPNFMKIDPVVRAVRDPSRIRLVHTGQHYDHAMSQSFFDELGLPRPDVNLGVGSASITVQTATVMQRYEESLPEPLPEMTVVVGDVNSTLSMCPENRKATTDNRRDTGTGQQSASRQTPTGQGREE